MEAVNRPTAKGSSRGARRIAPDAASSMSGTSLDRRTRPGGASKALRSLMVVIASLSGEAGCDNCH